MKLNSHFRYTLLFLTVVIEIKTACAQVNVGPQDQNRTNEIEAYLIKLVNIIKSNSPYARALNWEEVNKELALKADNLTSMAKSGQLAEYMISQLKAAGDKHSFLMSAKVNKSYADGTFVVNKPKAELISENIGLITIPNLSTSNSQIHLEYATAIQDMIKNLDSDHIIKGWIIDLRSNTGGSMYPMIAGIGPLTRSGKLGYFVHYVNGKAKYTPWYYKNGVSGLGSAKFIRVNRPYRQRNMKTKVAVLIGKSTSSAGEMTAISFSGAKNVRIFGQPSAGLTTGNEPFKLPDGSTLYLAMRYTANRNKKIFKDQIDPDQVIALGKDNAEIDAAKKWLLTAEK